MMSRLLLLSVPALLSTFPVEVAAAASPNRPLPTQARATAAEPLVMASDTGLGVVRFMNPARKTIVKDVDVRKLAPDECRTPQGALKCFLLGADHVVQGDHDFLVIAASGVGPGFVGKVALGQAGRADKMVWRLGQLDFSKVDSNGSCTATCGGGRATASCKPVLVHSVELTAEDTTAQWAELTFAEMGNSRIVHVRLDYRNGNSCGEVLWVLDSHNPAWPGTSTPNGFQELSVPEGDFLVTTMLAQDSSLQAGGGRIMFWEWQGTQLERVWEYPPDLGGADSYLNAVHHGLIETDPTTGQRYLTYGHSLGTSDRWNDGTGGTWGMAALDDLYAGPDYLTDLIPPPSDDPVQFSRELNFLEDGTVLAMDAGSYFPGDSDAGPPDLWWFEVGALPNSSFSGQYSTDQSHLAVTQLGADSVVDHLQCGMNDLFTVEMLEESRLGAELRALSPGGTVCPTP